MRNEIKESICKKIDDLKSICLNDKYSDNLCNDISTLLSYVIDRLYWMTLGEKMNGAYLTEEQFDKLIEYKKRFLK